jgi:hypothetical protein
MNHSQHTNRPETAATIVRLVWVLLRVMRVIYLCSGF